MNTNFKLRVMGLKNGMRDEINEMIDYIIENDSYLRGKLDKKDVGNSFDLKVWEDELKNVKNDEIKGIIKDKMVELDKKRGEELIKRYGGLILSKSVVDRGLGKKKKK